MSWTRIAALARKDAAELAASKTIWLGPLAMLTAAVVLPPGVVLAVPAWVDASSSSLGELVEVVRVTAWHPGLGLDDAALVQAFVLHRFLPLLALVPVVSTLTIVTTSIVTEKQARTLEPLLATPLTSGELLVAKIATAFAGAMTLTGVGFLLLVAIVAMAGRPGVAATFFAAEPLLLMWLVAPSASLLTLVLGTVVSTRAKDARAAQQFGVVVVVPFVAVFMSGLSGGAALSQGVLVAAAAVLIVLAAVVGRIAVARFEHERMLTDWT